MRKSAEQSPAAHVALSKIWKALLAYLLLNLLPIAFGADLPAILPFQPNVGWIASISGIFVIVWGVMSTGIGISMSRQTVTRPEKV